MWSALWQKNGHVTLICWNEMNSAAAVTCHDVTFEGKENQKLDINYGKMSRKWNL